jgi:hypothetical protein
MWGWLVSAASDAIVSVGRVFSDAEGEKTGSPVSAERPVPSTGLPDALMFTGSAWDNSDAKHQEEKRREEMLREREKLKDEEAEKRRKRKEEQFPMETKRQHDAKREQEEKRRVEEQQRAAKRRDEERGGERARQRQLVEDEERAKKRRTDGSGVLSRTHQGALSNGTAAMEKQRLMEAEQLRRRNEEELQRGLRLSKEVEFQRQAQIDRKLADEEIQVPQRQANEALARQKREAEERERIARQKAEVVEREREQRQAQIDRDRKLADEKFQIAQRQANEALARQKREAEERERIARQKAEVVEREREQRQAQIDRDRKLADEKFQIAQRQANEALARQKREAEERERIARQKAEVVEREREQHARQRAVSQSQGVSNAVSVHSSLQQDHVKITGSNIVKDTSVVVYCPQTNDVTRLSLMDESAVRFLCTGDSHLFCRGVAVKSGADVARVCAQRNLDIPCVFLQLLSRYPLVKSNAPVPIIGPRLTYDVQVSSWYSKLKVVTLVLCVVFVDRNLQDHKQQRLHSTCSVCTKRIAGGTSFITIDGFRCHDTCFACCVCGQVTNSVLSSNEGQSKAPVCKDCSEKRSIHCCVDNAKIEGNYFPIDRGNGKAVYVCEAHKDVASCWVCSVRDGVNYSLRSAPFDKSR